VNTAATPPIKKVVLNPGDFYFGDRHTQIETLLGSCISVTMWHPKLLIGGMCHYMLPSRSDKQIRQLDGRYGNEAILMFFREAMRHNADPNEFVVKVFGGGQMFASHKDDACRTGHCQKVIHSCRNVACKNIVLSNAMLGSFGFKIASQDLGGTSSRKIIFDVGTGDVWVRQNDPKTSPINKAGKP
jgi:chemotaxis protein CheD